MKQSLISFVLLIVFSCVLHSRALKIGDTCPTASPTTTVATTTTTTPATSPTPTAATNPPSTTATVTDTTVADATTAPAVMAEESSSQATTTATPAVNYCNDYITNSQCIAGNNNTCQCITNYVASKDNKLCQKSLNAACSGNEKCYLAGDVIEGIKCNGKTCACIEGYKVTDDKKSCKKNSGFRSVVSIFSLLPTLFLTSKIFS